MTTIDDLQRMALELESVDKALKRVSHYKVNRKIYELMKTIEYSDIIYHPKLDALVLNGKPVFIDDKLEDGIATYNHKETESKEPINLYIASTMMAKTRPIRPISFVGAI